MHQNLWRLGLCPRPRWGSLHNTTIVEIHDTLFKISALDASILVQNAPKSLAAGAPPQTSLGELTYHWLNPWHYSKSSHQMLPFQSKMQLNRWWLGLCPRPHWGSLHIPRMKSMTTGWKSNLMNASSRNTHNSKSLHQNVTRCFHFSPTCSKIVGGWGSAPDPAEGAYIILPLLKSITHYSKSVHLMLPF